MRESFELLENLGVGGTANVWKAKNKITDKIVALKVIQSHLLLDDKAKKRFFWEGELLKTLNHPNLVQFIGIHEAENQMSLELEYVDGCNLSQWQSEHDVPFWEVKLWILARIARGLGALHEKQILHRDIKPENVLITKEGEIKISDLGVARSTLRTTVTQVGSFVGSLQYMSPESINGDNQNRSSDLFSLGIIAYELLAGFNPFSSETAQGSIRKILDSKRPNLALDAPYIPLEIQNLVHECLSVDPKKRPKTAWEIESRLMSLIIDQKLYPKCQSLVSPLDQKKNFKEAFVLKNEELTVQIKEFDSNRSRVELIRLLNEKRHLFPENSESLELPVLSKPRQIFANISESRISKAALISTAAIILFLLSTLIFIQSNSDEIDKISQKQAAIKKLDEFVKKDSEQKTLKKKTIKRTPRKRIPQKKKIVQKLKYGVVQFLVDSDVDVFVDQKKLKKSELSSAQILSGTREVKLVKKGYNPIVQQMTIQAGKTITINARSTR